MMCVLCESERRLIHEDDENDIVALTKITRKIYW